MASNSPTSFSASSLPTGLQLNPATGVITGAVAIAGSYTSTISAISAAGTGEISLVWNISADLTLPSVPTGVASNVVSLNSTNISWTASSDNVSVTTYQVESDGITIGATAGTILTLGSLTPGGTYAINVRAGDAAGNWSAWSTTLNVTMPTYTLTPTTVSNLNYATLSPTTVTLMWSASSDVSGISGYNIYRNGTLVGTTSGLAFVDAGLTPSTTYGYTVVAEDENGNLSATSLTLSVTTATDNSLDTDHDGIPDSVETLLGTNPSVPATIDTTNQLQFNLQQPTQ